MISLRFAATILILFTPFAAAADFPICGKAKRVTCVVDGDTLWLHGEKIRLQAIDAPERDGAKCKSERDLAEASTERLAALLSGGAITIRRNGEDRFGRTLAMVLVDGVDVGDKLVEEGLARIWRGRREPWCDRPQS